MNIKHEILSVQTDGDTLSVKVQGKAVGDAEWRPYLSATIQIPDTKKNRRAFYIGRMVSLQLVAL